MFLLLTSCWPSTVATIAKVKGFLMVVKYENPSVSGEIVNWFQINGNLDTEEGFLTEEDLMKVTSLNSNPSPNPNPSPGPRTNHNHNHNLTPSPNLDLSPNLNPSPNLNLSPNLNPNPNLDLSPNHDPYLRHNPNLCLTLIIIWKNIFLFWSNYWGLKMFDVNEREWILSYFFYYNQPVGGRRVCVRLRESTCEHQVHSHSKNPALDQGWGFRKGHPPHQWNRRKGPRWCYVFWRLMLWGCWYCWDWCCEVVGNVEIDVVRLLVMLRLMLWGWCSEIVGNVEVDVVRLMLWGWWYC